MNLNNTLFELLGNFEKVRDFDEYGYATFQTDEFRVDVQGKVGIYLVSIDLKSCFDKPSRSPINFICGDNYKVSKRKMARIREGVNFLRRNAKIAGEFFGEMPGFDDLGSAARQEFYSC